MPAAVVEPRGGEGERGVAQGVLQRAVGEGEAAPAQLPDLHHHQQTVRLRGAEGEAVEPRQRDGVEAGVVDREPAAGEPLGGFEVLAAVAAAPARGAPADVPAPALLALAPVLAGVRHAELPPLGTPAQRAVVEDEIVEISEFVINFEIPDAAV